MKVGLSDEGGVLPAYVTGVVVVGLTTPLDVIAIVASWCMQDLVFGHGILEEYGRLRILLVAFPINVCLFAVPMGVILYALKDRSISTRRMAVFVVLAIKLGLFLAFFIYALHAPSL